jgi:hypothetical protein
MKVLIQGDSHGQVNDIIPKIYSAGKYKIQHVLVCGDFGLWTHVADGHQFLDEVEEAARINNLTVYAIGGNHENWDHWNWFVDNMPTHKGFAMVRRRVLLAPKVHRWTWANKTFIGAGGAVSIDKESRLAAERGGNHYNKNWGIWEDHGRGTGPRTLYWPNEQLLDADVDKLKTFGHADYLITHDCSNYTPWKDRLKPDMDSQIHRQRIDEVLKSVQPDMHWHGHMHQQYDWVNDYSGGGARTIGLEAFNDFNSWGVLDVDTGRWWWPGEYAEHLEDRAERIEQAKLDANEPEKARQENIATFSDLVFPTF